MPVVSRVLVAALALAALGACGQVAEAAESTIASPAKRDDSSATAVVADRTCEAPGDEWIDGPVRTARVRADVGARLPFERGGEGCPGGDDCRMSAYLVPGDRVLVAHGGSAWSCAWYASADFRSTSGYLPTNALEFDPVAAPSRSDWAGDWVDSVDAGDADTLDEQAYSSQAELELREATDGAIEVSGSAFWIGPVIDGQGNRSVHDGSIEGRFVPEGARGSLAAAGEFECAAEFRRVADVLLVRDNLQCGGVNVRFFGLFRRKETK